MVASNTSTDAQRKQEHINIPEVLSSEGCTHFVLKDHTPESAGAAMYDFDENLSQLYESLRDDPSRIGELLADLSELAVYHRRLTEAVTCLEGYAMFDVLTGLPNKRHFHEVAHMHVSHALRQERHGMPQQLHALFIDLDHFKEINDDPRFGHDIGDLYLMHIARHMKGALHREYDLVARIGGDEFASLLLDCTEEMALMVAERLREAVRVGSAEAKGIYEEQKGIKLHEGEANVTASIGLATLDGGGDSVDALLKRADRAMYEAKHAGKDRITVAPEPDA